ncbi:hypothetical protein M3Y99_00300300 [Aphelenchoides fujianensis]|nr:hypothetical protein M3Y99_00300300 [Aphelenchoides fujianensis]
MATEVDRVDNTLIKPFVYGNSAELLPRKTPDNHTHRWRLFVRAFFEEDVTKYIRKVQFRLHESYKNMLRTVDTPDADGFGFSVEETGWGEFEAQIKIFFTDINEKPVTFPYYIRLFKPEFTKPDGRKYVLYEHYDEIIFTDPTVQMFTALYDVSEKREIKTATDFDKIKRETIGQLQAALHDVSEEIVDLREKLRVVAADYEQAYKSMEDGMSRAVSVEGSIDSALMDNERKSLDFGRSRRTTEADGDDQTVASDLEDDSKTIDLEADEKSLDLSAEERRRADRKPADPNDESMDAEDLDDDRKTIDLEADEKTADE